LAALTVAALLLVAACSSSGGSSSSTGAGASSSGSGKDFVIGTVEPLTGQYATNGNAINNGMKVGVAEVNAAGGILGRHVVLETIDDQAQPAQELLGVQKLESEGIDLLFPDSFSPLGGASLPYTTTHKILTMNLNSNPDLLDGSKYPYQFSDGENSTARGPAEAFAIKQADPGAKIGILYDASNGTENTTATGFKAIASKYGLTVTKMVNVSPDATDVTAELTQLKQSGATVVLAAIQQNGSPHVLMNSVAGLGWDVPVWMFPEDITGDLASMVPASVASQFHAVNAGVSIKTNPPDPALQAYVSQLAAVAPVGYLAGSIEATELVWLAKWGFETAQQKYGNTSSDSVAKVFDNITTEDYPTTHALVWKAGPGWTQQSHGTALANYSTFYGVIGPVAPVNGQYAGVIMTQTSG
jgi:ABC-type branched-subunit amino acid transport system substrate-binding protein